MLAILPTHPRRTGHDYWPFTHDRRPPFGAIVRDYLAHRVYGRLNEPEQQLPGIDVEGGDDGVERPAATVDFHVLNSTC
jgi:hypothetical protein